MLQETETEQTIRIFCHIFVLGNISIGGGPSPPLATPMSSIHDTSIFDLRTFDLIKNIKIILNYKKK